MFRQTSQHKGLSVAITPFLMMAFAAVGFAQNQAPSNSAAAQRGQRYEVSIIQVQLASQDAWEKLIKEEYMPAMKKAGITQLSVMKSDTFGKRGEYRMSRPIQDIAELDGPDPVAKVLGSGGAKALYAKLDRITESVHTFMSGQLPELSVFPAPGYMPKHINLITQIVAPGRTVEYEKYSKERFAVARKVEGKGMIFSKKGNGGNPDSYVTMFFFDSYAEGGKNIGALQTALREAGIWSPPAGIVVSEERADYVFLPELSILSTAQQTRQ